MPVHASQSAELDNQRGLPQICKFNGKDFAVSVCRLALGCPVACGLSPAEFGGVPVPLAIDVTRQPHVRRAYLPAPLERL